jgi:hypothetical protein
MVVTKKFGVVAGFILTLATLAAVGCGNSLTGTDGGHRDAPLQASRDSTGGGTCLTGWIVVDGITTCPGGH